MKGIRIAFAGVAIVASNITTSTNRFDFACYEVKALVRLMQEGPTEVINRAADDPVVYRDRSIRGWTCLMTPLPPMRNGRPYLQSLDCYSDNGDNHVTEQELAASGTLFQKNLASFYACFGTDLLNEAPVSYTQNNRGEGIRAVLRNSYNGRHVIVQYGYLWDQVQTGRIVWQSIVGYAASNGASDVGSAGGSSPGRVDYKACSAQCKDVENQCINECGSGPDHVNNPNWYNCRQSCRSDNKECRSGCL